MPLVTLALLNGLPVAGLLATLAYVCTRPFRLAGFGALRDGGRLR
jgi:hypothetical protein